MAEVDEVSALLKIDYIRYIKAHLNHWGAWPAQELGQKGSKFAKIRKIVFLMITLSVMVEIYTVLKMCSKKLDFEILGQCYLNGAIIVTSVQRYTIPLFPDFSKYLTKMLTKTHIYYFKNKSEYATEIFIKVNRVCKITATAMYLELYCGMVIAQFGDTFSNYNSGLFTADSTSNITVYMNSPIYIYVPFSYYSNLLYAISVPTIQYLAFINCAPVMTYDLILFVSLSTLWGHVKILKHDLATFPRPQMEKDGRAGVGNPAWYSKEESVMVRKRLVALIDHHRLMKEFSVASSDIYGMMLLCYYAVLQFSQIITMLQIENLNLGSFCKYGVLGLLAFQLLTTVSIALELVASESEDLWTAVYNLPWECMDVSNRRLVFFFMCNAQKNLGFKAKDLLDVGVRTAFSIIKTSCSCYLFLRTLTQT